MRSAILREKKKREKEEKKELLRTASNSLQVSFFVTKWRATVQS